MAVICMAPLLGGCGYTTHSMVREDIRSIYVPVFENSTYRRGFERSLTAAVVTEIRRFTNLRIVPAGAADSILTGKITKVEEAVETKTVDDEVLQRSIALTVKLCWRDALTKRDIIPPCTIRERVKFVPQLGEPFGEKAFRETAERIVEKLWGKW